MQTFFSPVSPRYVGHCASERLWQKSESESFIPPIYHLVFADQSNLERCTHPLAFPPGYYGSPGIVFETFVGS